MRTLDTGEVRKYECLEWIHMPTDPDADLVLADPENLVDPFRGERPNEVSGWRTP
jgi:hypothetical protein